MLSNLYFVAKKLNINLDYVYEKINALGELLDVKKLDILRLTEELQIKAINIEANISQLKTYVDTLLKLFYNGAYTVEILQTKITNKTVNELHLDISEAELYTSRLDTIAIRKPLLSSGSVAQSSAKKQVDDQDSVNAPDVSSTTTIFNHLKLS